jgi:hypothetical protein
VSWRRTAGRACIRARPMFSGQRLAHLKGVGRRRATGDVTDKLGGGPKPTLAAHYEALRAEVAQKRDATLAELEAWFAAVMRRESASAACGRVSHLGLTLSTPRSGTAST